MLTSETIGLERLLVPPLIDSEDTGGEYFVSWERVFSYAKKHSGNMSGEEDECTDLLLVLECRDSGAGYGKVYMCLNY